MGNVQPTMHFSNPGQVRHSPTDLTPARQPHGWGLLALRLAKIKKCACPSPASHWPGLLDAAAQQAWDGWTVQSEYC